ncbi:MAG: YunC family protein [Thermoplasmata archaeon]
MEIENIRLDNGNAMGLRWNLGNAYLLIIKREKGYLMCGYLNMEIANRVGDIAGIVSGVSTFDEMLEKPVNVLSKKAIETGIKPGINGKEFLELLG